MRKLLVATLSLILSALVINQYASAAQTAKKALKVGVILCLSGPGAAHGHNMQNGIELARKDLQKQGWSLDIAYEDDQTNSAKTIAALESLSARGYKTIIGGTWSSQVESMMPTLERSGLLLYAPALASPIVSSANRNSFFGSGLGQKKTVVAEWLKSVNAKKAGIAYMLDSWGEFHKKLLSEAAKDSGVQIIGERTLSPDNETPDITAALAQFRSAGADVILSIVNAEGNAQLVKKAGELQIKSSFLGTNDLEDAVNQGLISFNSQTPQLFALHTTASTKFNEHYKAAYGVEAPIYSEAAYDGLIMFAQAASATDGSIKALRDFLHKDLDYQSLSSHLKSDETGDVRQIKFQVLKLNPEKGK